METVLMRSPSGEEKEVAATSEALTPLMAAGWQQAPAAPAKTPATAATEEK
jgi:hypothetical protein